MSAALKGKEQRGNIVYIRGKHRIQIIIAQTDGRTDGRADGGTDGRTDGRTDGKHVVLTGVNTGR